LILKDVQSVGPKGGKKPEDLDIEEDDGVCSWKGRQGGWLICTQDEDWGDEDPLGGAEVGEFDYLSCNLLPYGPGRS
jgi:hypothetical protein